MCDKFELNHYQMSLQPLPVHLRFDDGNSLRLEQIHSLYMISYGKDMMEVNCVGLWHVHCVRSCI